MPEQLEPLVRSFAGLNALVIGDAMLDTYMQGRSSRISREAPVPIVAIRDREEVPGGCANTAANLRLLGAQVRIVATVGDDAQGRRLCSLLEAAGIDCQGLVRIRGWQTLTKTRVIASGQMLLRFDLGEGEPLPEPVRRALSRRVQSYLEWADVIIVSDYDYGVLCAPVIQVLQRHLLQQRAVMVVDSKDPTRFRDLHPTAVKPNFEELTRIVGNLPSEGNARTGIVARLGEDILEATGASIAAVTLDREGALIFERGRQPYRTYAKPASDSRAAGAGDTFVAAFGLALGAGAGTAAAGEVASAAANLVVGQEGTVACSADALVDSFLANDKVAADLGRLARRAAQLRRQGKRIVFTNGCFDILHSGHVSYLNAAKALGDVLVVGVNSDESVARLKGPARPINTLDERLKILAGLSCIDNLVPFEGDTPVALIEALRPDVFVKGGDYTRESLPEAEAVEQRGGRVEILPYVEERSTTGIISRIRGLATA